MTRIAPLALALCLGLAAAAHAETLRWARAGDALTLDPHARNEGVTLTLLHQMLEPLILRAPDGSLEAALATAWAIDPTAPDTWIIELREGVQFHDGAAFTAEDVVFSLTRAMSEESDMKGNLTSVASVTARGPRRVAITTKGPNPLLPAALTNVFIIDKGWAETNGAGRVQEIDEGIEGYAARNVNGTGPYALVAREPDVRTELAAFEGYWGRETFPLAFDRIVFLPLANPATRVAALLSGEADFIQDVPVQDLERIAQTPGLKVVSSPQNRAIFFGLNQGDRLVAGNIDGQNPLADVRVRRAMNLALDREAISQVVMRGQSIPAGVIMPPFVDGWSKKLNAVETDVEKAKALMAEAGWEEGFPLVLHCPNDRYINDAATCQAAVAMLARIGITVTLDARTKAQHFPQVAAQETDFYMMGWGVPTYDSEFIFNFLYHSRVEPFGSWNSTRYVNPELDALIAAIASEVDLEKRASMIRSVWQIVKDDVVYLPIHHQVLNWAMRADISATVDPDDQVKAKYFSAN